MEGNNADLMKTAREQYFKTNLQAHAAWRGYDNDAPYEGGVYFPNLLTEQKFKGNIFSGHEAARGRDEVSNIEASNEVREMVAYYYLLVIDKKDMGGSGTEADIQKTNSMEKS